MIRLLPLLLKAFIIAVIAPFHVGGRQLEAGTNETFELPTSIKITPFQLEIRSLYSSNAPENASVDLKTITEEHISSHIKNSNSYVWNKFQSISLYPEEEDLNSIFNRSRQLRNKDNRHLRASFTFKVLYSGSLTFSSGTEFVPTKEEIEAIILQSFVAQGKLDYIRSLRLSDDTFLSFTNYANVWLPSESETSVSTLSNDKLFVTIASVAVVVIIMTIIVAVYYNCCYQPNEKQLAAAAKGGTAECAPDIRLAVTRSTSQSPTNDKQSRPKYSSHPYRNIHSQRSFVTKSTRETFCPDGSFDVIGWKSNGLNLNTPFEVDLSMISKVKSDEHELDIPREIVGGRKGSSATPLSKGVLSEHNKQQYGKHPSRSHRT